MAGRNRPGDTPPGGRPGRPHGSGGRSISSAQESVSADAELGRSSGRGGSHPADDVVTHPTGSPGGTPDGRPTPINPNEDDNVRRSLDRENSGAAILADQGYRIKQNPSPDEVAQARLATGDSGRPTSKPDYILDGRVFDCYSPSATKPVRGIWHEVSVKVNGNQTQRVVVNLQDWPGDVSAVQKQFEDWPLDKLKEVKIITPGGEIRQIIPRENS